jgi:hypothetical protein
LARRLTAIAVSQPRSLRDASCADEHRARPQSWGAPDLHRGVRAAANQIPKAVFSRQGPAILRKVNTTAELDEARAVGLPLFSELAAPTPFKLMSSKAFSGGAVAQIYRAA